MTGATDAPLLLLCFTSLLLQAKCATVTTSKGVVNGFQVNYGTQMNPTQQYYYGSADVFLGIPYAEPPIGPLRFQPPQSKTAWNSPLNATSFYSYTQCPQPPSSIIGAPSMNSSEDCLYLNVFSPNVASISKYPVMVWIHGGALVAGSAAMYGTMGAVRNLVSRGVVVVTFQYRLGLLGFFTTKTSDFPANLGMLDQVMALQWVKQEISAFGGDPSNVTIFGESAGGASVSAHTYSPLSKGLFQKAIMQSGVALLTMEGAFEYKNLSQVRSMQLCNFTSGQWASGNFSSLKQCLENMPYQRFLDLEWDNPYGWYIVKDNNFLPSFPQDLAANRTNISVMIGTNRDEWAFFELKSLLAGVTTISKYTKQYYQEQAAYLTKFYGQNQTMVMQLIDKVYAAQKLPTPDPVKDNLAWLQIITQVATDLYFVSPAAAEAYLWQSVNRNPNVYLYEFVYPTNIFALNFNITWRPVYHAEDLFYTWMQDSLWANNSNVSTSDIAVANFLGQTWTDFAKYGKPSWSAVTSDNPYQYMEIGANITMKQSYGETARALWNEVIPALVGVFPRDPSNNPTSTMVTTTHATAITSGCLNVMTNNSIFLVIAAILALWVKV